MSDAAIRVEGLGKKYRLGPRERYKSLRDSVMEAATALWKRPAPSSSEEIWALKDVSFEVKRGQVLGVVGGNGAGKTTLLKILSRITEPTTGRAVIRGRIGSLLEVGTGFHPELSGRDNVFLSGAILGMSRREIRKKFDQIVEFSGVERFIDTPMKRYSSGMQVRLAFAIAAHLEPDIFLIDEVLAVGDMAFQEKCIGKMGEVASSGRTILFVSHNMNAVRSLCTQGLLLRGGSVQLIGNAGEVVDAYTKAMSGAESEGVSLADRTDRSGSGQVRVTGFEASSGNTQKGILVTGCGAEFVVRYASKKKEPIANFWVLVWVTNANGVNIFACTPSMTPQRTLRNAPPDGEAVCRMDRVPLLPGKYWVNVLLKVDLGPQGIVDQIHKAGQITVVDDGSAGLRNLDPGHVWGSVVVSHEWSVRDAHPAPQRVG